MTGELGPKDNNAYEDMITDFGGSLPEGLYRCLMIQELGPKPHHGYDDMSTEPY